MNRLRCFITTLSRLSIAAVGVIAIAVLLSPSFQPQMRESVIIGGLFLVGLLIGLSIMLSLVLMLCEEFVRAQAYMARRDAMSYDQGGKEAMAAESTKHSQLQSSLESMQRDERISKERFRRRRCSAEDVLRAEALRLQAEIALIRHQKRPKTWAEACREYDLRRSSESASV